MNKKSLHLRKVEQARQCFADDKGLASTESYVMTFDLQKALPFPKLTTSTAYYKRNLYVYNFGIFSFNLRKSFMYMWNETEGGKESQELASCVVHHLKMHASTHSKIILYSDSCTGQNRNIKMSLSLMKLSQDPNMEVSSIDHKFLISGHSYLPNDGDFGIIEKASRKISHIYTPKDWMDIVRESKKKPPKFEVIEMKNSDFYSTKNLEDAITNRKKTIDGYDFNWLNIRWLHYERDSPFTLMSKETLNSEVQLYNIDLRKISSSCPATYLHNIQQSLLYKQRRAEQKQRRRTWRICCHIFHLYITHFPNSSCENPTRSLKSLEPEDEGTEYIFL